MSKNIFFIGPASVGKTTVASLLAERLGYKFVDVDKQFCGRIALIPDVVRNEGYPTYCEKNSKLVDELITENPQKTVFATPSGYLVHEDSPHLVKKHIEVIGRGVSILLLPDKDPSKGVDLIVSRQLNRWNDIAPDKERERFYARFERYKTHGDIKIFSMERPDVIVGTILEELTTLM